jgi:DNA repair exonuclease SbcCD ATPase subunit
MLSTFFYHEWDVNQKELLKVQAQYNTQQTLAEIEQKNLEALKRAEDQNKVLTAQMDKIDKKLSDLYKLDASIKAPTQEKYDAIQKANINDLYNIYSSLGYSTKITR